MSLSFFDPAFDSCSIERMAAVRWACQSASETRRARRGAPASSDGPPARRRSADASPRVAASRAAADGGSGGAGAGLRLAFPAAVAAGVELASIPPVTGGSGDKAGRLSTFTIEIALGCGAKAAVASLPSPVRERGRG